MKSFTPFKKYFWILSIIFSVESTSAQITFPKGNSIDTVSSSLLMYFETQVIFLTHKFKANEYSWQKISDSLDSRWLVTACFNGDCRNTLLSQGDFINDFGYNDSTCFLAFHVESHGYQGTSEIKYKVYNRNNPADSGRINVRVSYINFSGTDNIKNSPEMFSVYPNPATDKLFIETSENYLMKKSFCLFDSFGKKIILDDVVNLEGTNKFNINLQQLNLSKGLYLLCITSNNKTDSMHKIMVR